MTHLLPPPSERIEILPPSAGERLRPSECTAYTADSTGYWQVPEADARAIDARLLVHVDSLFDELRHRPDFSNLSRASAYSRQYLGVQRGERRVVFVSGTDEWIYNWLLSSGNSLSQLQGFRLAPSDAGTGVFGIEFDIGSRQFTRLRFSCSFAGLVRY